MLARAYRVSTEPSSPMLKRFAFLATVLPMFALSSPAVEAQQRAATLESRAPYHATARSEQTLRHFDPAADEQLVWTITDIRGYVFGTNEYGDLAKAVGFELPAGVEAFDILSVTVYGFRGATPQLDSYQIIIYDGTPTSGPGDELMAQTFPISTLPAGSTPPVEGSAHPLESPFTVTSSFFVAVDWQEGSAGFEDIGIMATDQLPTPSPFEWEMWGDGEWYEVADAWSASWHMWIEVVGDVPTNNETGAPHAV